MPTYRITTPGGQTLRLTGDQPPTKEDIDNIVMKMGFDQSVASAEAGAKTRSEAPPEHLTVGNFMRDENLGTPLPGTQGGRPINTEGALTYAGAAGMAPIVVEAPVATALTLGRSALGGALAAKAGRYLAPELGLQPETGATIGRIGGAVLGGVSPKTLMDVLRAGGNPSALFKTMAGLPGTETAAATPITTKAPALAAEALEKTMVEYGMAPAQAKAAATAAIENAPIGQAIPAGLPGVVGPASQGQGQLKIIAQLRSLAQQNPGNKTMVKEAAKELFPQSWQEVMDMIMAKNTKPATIFTPGPK